MKLHAFDWVVAVAKPHDLAFLRFRAHFKEGREGVSFARSVSGSAPPVSGLRRPLKMVRPSFKTGEVLPCMSLSARTTSPPKA